MQFLYQKMEAAGWIVDEERNSKNSYAKSVEKLKEDYLNLPGGAGGVERFWYDNNGLEAHLRLVKTVTGMPVEMESRFNIVIDIWIIRSDASKHAKLDEKGYSLLPKYDDKDDAGQRDDAGQSDVR